LRLKLEVNSVETEVDSEKDGNVEVDSEKYHS